jgi:hypothetical protein
MKTFRDSRLKALRSIDPAKKGTPAEFVGKNFVEAAKALDSKTDVKASDIQALNKAYRGISFSKKPKGASVWDFDDTLARTKSDVLFTSPDGVKGKLSAEEFATQGSELLADGYEFDFSEFNKVTEGATWQIKQYGSKSKKQKRLTEQEMMTKFKDHWGVLMAGYWHAGSGWWRARPQQTADVGSILICEDKEGAIFGEPYLGLTCAKIEALSPRELEILASDQKTAYYDTQSMDKKITENQITEYLECEF